VQAPVSPSERLANEHYLPNERLVECHWKRQNDGFARGSCALTCLIFWCVAKATVARTSTARRACKAQTGAAHATGNAEPGAGFQHPARYLWDLFSGWKHPEKL